LEDWSQDLLIHLQHLGNSRHHHLARSIEASFCLGEVGSVHLVGGSHLRLLSDLGHRKSVD
jgi:hypothetical protein